MPPRGEPPTGTGLLGYSARTRLPPDSVASRDPTVQAWADRGEFRRVGGREVFTIDLGPLGEERAEPLLIVHGFPTCSYDYRHVLDDLAVHRRVLVLDLLGFGLSEKPNVRYSIGLHADIVQGFVEQAGVSRLALLTHDMGDTVGGELLARQHEGQWAVEITRRALTNGSIYIEMAHLTAGQELLLSLPDRSAEAPPDENLLRASLAETMAPASGAARADLSGDAALVCHRAGNAMLPRTIRYIEDRRAFQARYTGAIERHPSPLTIIWGTEDPIAVVEMAERLSEARPDAPLCRLPRVGHYPMLEAPGELLAALEAALS